MSTSIPHNEPDTGALPEIPGFRLRQVLNHGGMSTVYLGEQIALGREVAVKVMRPMALADEVSRRRFENEVRTIARLEHPNVVTIHEVGRTRDGLPYYAMPYLPRGHLGLRDFMKDGLAKGEPQVISIMEALLGALEYAHARGVVHRDVKAENVLFDITERPLLADFGIALRRGFGPRVTATGLAVGSTAYMAPEQARGEDVDGRADLYSLGVLGWEMLTGRLPFEAADALSMAVMHAQDPIPKLPASLKHWQRFMNRALAKQPDQRFRSASEMLSALADIRRLGAMNSVQRAMNRVRGLRRWLTPAWAGLAVLAVALVMLAFGLNRAGEDGFFRPAPAPLTPPSSNVQEPTDDPTQAMLAPLPEAPLQRSLEDARRYIAQGRLASPADANAYHSVLTAWNLDSTNPEVRKVVDELLAAFGDQFARDLREGNDQNARAQFANATALGQQTGNTGPDLQRSLQEKAASALQARVEQAAKRNDRADAKRIAAIAEDLKLPKPTSTRLIADARSVGSTGMLAAKGAVVSIASDTARGTVRITARPVSRGDFARFAAASGRRPALCRERASLLRVLAPKDWTAPGFVQNEAEPVVCVSQQDAEAYASWFSQQTGHRYRLPTAAEAEQLYAQTSGRTLSMWSRDCGRNCEQRQAAGTSWRTKQDRRALSAGRGYDDVGFRLVRER